MLVAAAALGSCAAPDDSALPQPRPSSSFTLPLSTVEQVGSDGVPLRSAGPRHTGRFSLVGVVWDDPRQPLGATVRVRTHRPGGQWSNWLTLDGSDADTPTPEANGGHPALGGTPPLWVGPSDGVQVDIQPDRLAEARQPEQADLPEAARLPSSVLPLPTGLRLALVDAGDGSAGAAAQLAGAGPAASGQYAAPEPAIIPRAVWATGAQQPDTPIQYADEVRAVFLHHTDSGNGYDCREAPEVIRSIEEYHVKDRSYDDIGYNFLVDRCGNIYEGRPGGVDRPVIGAHTLGFNIGTAGIAAIGSFPEGVSVPRPMLDAIARLVAWKLGLAGVDPRGVAMLTSSDSGARFSKGTTHVFNTVSGHRDGGWTFCPGGALYEDLPQIRAEAARLQHRPGL